MSFNVPAGKELYNHYWPTKNSKEEIQSIIHKAVEKHSKGKPILNIRSPLYLAIQNQLIGLTGRLFDSNSELRNILAYIITKEVTKDSKSENVSKTAINILYGMDYSVDPALQQIGLLPEFHKEIYTHLGDEDLVQLLKYILIKNQTQPIQLQKKIERFRNIAIKELFSRKNFIFALLTEKEKIIKRESDLSKVWHEGLNVRRYFFEYLNELDGDLNTLNLANMPITSRDLQLIIDSLLEKGIFLKKLDLSGCELLNDKSKDIFLMLPRNLEYLVFKINSNSQYLLQSLQNLPPNLQSLDLSILEGSIVEHLNSLPRSLTSLNIEGADVFSNMSIANLPPNLTHLRLRGDSITKEGVLLLPKDLEVLDLPSNTTIKDEDIALLPRNLKKLFLNNNLNLTASCLKSMPEKLEEMEVNIQDMQASFLKMFPVNLKTLKLDILLAAETIISLPQQLENLFVESVAVEPEYIKLLPKTLRTLEVTGEDSFNDDHLKDLPRSLEVLKLRGNNQITNAGIHYLSRLHLLRILDLSKNKLITDDSMSFIPRNLKELSLKFNNNLTDKGIRKLPKGLIFLDLYLNPYITEESIRYFENCSISCMYLLLEYESFLK